MENTPKPFKKYISHHKPSQVCSLIVYSPNWGAKNSIDGGIFTIAYVTEIFHSENMKILYYFHA